MSVSSRSSPLTSVPKFASFPSFWLKCGSLQCNSDEPDWISNRGTHCKPVFMKLFIEMCLVNNLGKDNKPHVGCSIFHHVKSNTFLFSFSIVHVKNSRIMNITYLFRLWIKCFMVMIYLVVCWQSYVLKTHKWGLSKILIELMNGKFTSGKEPFKGPAGDRGMGWGDVEFYSSVPVRLYFALSYLLTSAF